jgi:putative aldouronate transport system permease protein
MFILRIGTLLSVGYEKTLLLYNPATFETADIISTYVYRVGILGQDWSYSTAIGLFNSVINLTLLLCANRISRKVSETSLW